METTSRLSEALATGSEVSRSASTERVSLHAETRSSLATLCSIISIFLALLPIFFGILVGIDLVPHGKSVGIIAAAIGVATAAVCGWWLGSQVDNKLVQMRRVTEALRAGGFNQRIFPEISNSLASLAQSLNELSLDLQLSNQVYGKRGSEQETILASMAEGVISVDSQDRIAGINDAARRMLNIISQRTELRSVHEFIRNAELLRLIESAKKRSDPVIGTVIAHTLSGERSLEVTITPLIGAVGGLLLVLHDVTQLRRLEQVRKDFVANVSHELKTPITSIKGAVETLLDGAANDRESSRRFLEMIERHVDRVTMIFDDLLSLARLEQGDSETIFDRQLVKVAVVCRSAIGALDEKTRLRTIQVQLECPETLSVKGSASLLEQAIVNLLDNAIKHSDAGESVLVQARIETISGAELVRIDVIDKGCGIEPKHLTRIFERFYRVDAGRSRKAGGTGLGLSIVKHIAQVHDGTVEVESELGRGTTFTLRLPND